MILPSHIRTYNLSHSHSIHSQSTAHTRYELVMLVYARTIRQCSPHFLVMNSLRRVFYFIVVVSICQKVTACEYGDGFSCPSDGRCIDYTSVCDGIKDCPGGEDESLGCHTSVSRPVIQGQFWKCSKTTSWFFIELFSLAFPGTLRVLGLIDWLNWDSTKDDRGRTLK